MPLLASDVFTEAAALLNDVSKTMYTDAVMTPFLKKAYDSLQAEFALNGFDVIREESAAIDVVAGAVNTVVALPADFLFPVALHERVEGETSRDSWQPMTPQAWTEDLVPDQDLLYWNWREDTIVLPPVTRAKEVRLRYYKSLTVIASGATDIPVLYSKGYLASKAASYASLFIGTNETRASTLANDAEIEFNRILKICTKKLQLTVTAKRRDPFEGVF